MSLNTIDGADYCNECCYATCVYGCTEERCLRSHKVEPTAPSSTGDADAKGSDWEGSSATATPEDLATAADTLVGLMFTAPLAEFAARRIARALAHERQQERRRCEGIAREANGHEPTLEAIANAIAKETP